MRPNRSTHSRWTLPWRLRRVEVSLGRSWRRDALVCATPSALKMLLSAPRIEPKTSGYSSPFKEHDGHVLQACRLVAAVEGPDDASSEVSSLHPHAGGLVVQSPLEGSADLRQVRLRSLEKCVHDRRHAG
eukprot:90992-Rhodomonas_salina.1